MLLLGTIASMVVAMSLLAGPVVAVLIHAPVVTPVVAVGATSSADNTPGQA
jgi:hypothetical protein